MLKILGRASSSNTQKVAWAAAECGVHFKLVNTSGILGPSGHNMEDVYGLPTDFEQKSPMKLIPVLETGNKSFCESSTIIRYLAMKYKPALYGDTIEGLTECSMYMDLLETMNVGWWNGNLITHLVRFPAEERSREWVLKSQQRAISNMQWLNNHLSERKYVNGDQFTLSDITWGVETNRWMHFELEQPAMPSLENWYSRLKEGEHFVRHVVEPEAHHHSQKDH